MSTTEDGEFVQLFRAAEREWAAEHATYRQPRWLPVLAGAWVFSYLGGLQWIGGDGRMWWVLLHLALLFAFTWWDRRRRPESHRTRLPKAYRRYHLVVALVGLALLGMLPFVSDLGGWATAALASTVLTLGTWAANRTYDRITVAITEDIA